jgi:hypothetical protein
MIHLAIGRLEVDWGKNRSFNDHSALFQAEADVAPVPYHYVGDVRPDGGYEIVTELKDGLTKPLRLVVDRLELLGYTLANCEREFQFVAELNDFDAKAFPFARLAEALATVDVDTLDTDYGNGDEDFGKFFSRQIAPRLALDEDLACTVSQGMENLSAYSILRLLAQNPRAIELPVNWAFADIEAGGWADRANFVKGLASSERALIVTEGSSDAAIIRHALTLLRPHIADFFDFVDMEEGYPFSGTGNVYRFVQGLIAISVQNNILVVFDNDAEGVANYRRTGGLDLPPNMRVLKLPDIDTFATFKTVGPTGENSGDINGRAAAIECYLDLDAAACVRWSSYNPNIDAYQGELLSKGRYAKQLLEQRARVDGYNYEKIERILDIIVAAAVDIRSSMLSEELRLRG